MNLLNYLERNWMPFMDTDGAGGGAGNEGNDGNDGGNDGNKGGGEGNKNDEKKYSDKDVDAIIDKKFAQWQKKQEEKIAEAERLAKMSAEEKLTHERDKALKDAEEAMKKLNGYEMLSTARGLLREKGVDVPDTITETLIGADAESTKTNIEAFAAAFSAAVEDAVKARIKGKSQKTGGGGASITKEDIAKIKDPVERRKLILENKSLYE